MNIRKYGHSCLHVQHNQRSILIDPGNLSYGYENIEDLNAILITHAHADHVDLPRLALLKMRNPRATIFAGSATYESLKRNSDIDNFGIEVMRVGDRVDIGISIETFGGHHAIVHEDLEQIENLGYLIGDRLACPGDSLVVPILDIEILALPVMAPWMATKEAIDFVRAVSPAVAIPVHEGLLARPDRLYAIIAGLVPPGTEWKNLDDGTMVSF